MEYNLEKLKEEARKDEECFDNSYIWKALEGFEAELRQQLKNVEELGGSMGEKMLIKELLGE